VRLSMEGDADPFYLHVMEALTDGDAKRSTSIVAAVPLFDKREQVRGALGIEIDLESLFKLLPSHIYIQTAARNIVKPVDDGTMVLELPGIHLRGEEGVIKISETETLHYTQLEIPGAKKIIVAKYHQHELLTLAWKRLIVAALVLFFLFFSLITWIGYSAHLKIREKVLAQKAMIYSLIRLTDWRDHETGEHLERTRNYCTVIAKHLRKNSRYRKIITGRFMEDLYDASPLHDIGKVAIRDSILLKEGKLSDEEFNEMKAHVKIGAQIFEDIIHKFQIRHSLILMCRNICKYHHEKYNGKGYLKGLQGNEIPLEARIFALADVYDALRSQRSYKRAMSHEKTLEAIMRDRGEHFDPAVVDAFLAGEEEIKNDCRYRYSCT
jgi:HD-GYP domain-containing protein (c-di-GMP phosphodiesterase class II)